MQSAVGSSPARFGGLEWLTFSHLLLITAVAPRKGGDDLLIVALQSGLALCAFLTLLVSYRRSESATSPKEWQPMMGRVLLWSGVLFTIFGSTGYGENRGALMPWRFVSLPLLSVYLLSHEPPRKSLLLVLYRNRRLFFGALVLLAVGLRLAVPFISPEPTIDVFYFTNEGASGLLKGINPYDRGFTVIDPRSETLYAYLPGQFLLDLPSVFLLGDMRWGQIGIELLSAWMLYRLARGSQSDDVARHSAEIVALLFLYFPQVLRMQEQSWVEFKQIAAFFALLLWSSEGRLGWSWLVFGLLLTFKQTTWVALFFVDRMPTFRLRRLMQGLLVTSAVVVPFVIWNPSAFLEDIVWYHVHLPLPHSISLSRTIELATGRDPGLWPLAVGGALLLIWLRVTGRNSLYSFVIASTALGLLPVLARQAFLNYFYYLDAGILAGMALTLRETGRIPGEKSTSRAGDLERKRCSEAAPPLAC